MKENASTKKNKNAWSNRYPTEIIPDTDYTDELALQANTPAQAECQPHNLEQGGARGVMVIVAGCGHDDTSSNPGRAWLHFS